MVVDMVFHTLLFIGSTLLIWIILLRKEGFLYHFTALLAIFAISSVAAYFYGSVKARGRVWRLVCHLWDKWGVHLAIGLIVVTMGSWYYIMTSLNGNFMIQLLCFAGSIVVGCFGAAWAVSGPRTIDPPLPSRLPINKGRKETFARM